ncbi:TPA: serine protease [Proteus mirabilis]|nr:trypsin-like peptidase domain-containing protein [Proteus mirabilis]
MNIKSSLGENLEYATTRIISDTESIGTGFFIEFKHKGKENYSIPVLVTNKHVVKGANSIKFSVSVRNKKTSDYIKNYWVEIINLNQTIILHDDKDVDLCLIPIGPILNSLNEQSLEADIFPFPEDVIYINGSKEGHDISSLQEIHMTGYPNGLWDEVNNKPITRKGLTATNIKSDWNGKKQFIIDIACFPGSSGSPVYVYNNGAFVTGGNLVHGERLVLLGVLFAGPQITASGDIHIVDVPTDYKHIAVTNMMMNLGIIIKASELLVLKNQLLRKANLP